MMYTHNRQIGYLFRSVDNNPLLPQYNYNNNEYNIHCNSQPERIKLQRHILSIFFYLFLTHKQYKLSPKQTNRNIRSSFIHKIYQIHLDLSSNMLVVQYHCSIITHVQAICHQSVKISLLGRLCFIFLYSRLFLRPCACVCLCLSIKHSEIYKEVKLTNVHVFSASEHNVLAVLCYDMTGLQK